MLKNVNISAFSAPEQIEFFDMAPEQIRFFDNIYTPVSIGDHLSYITMKNAP